MLIKNSTALILTMSILLGKTPSESIPQVPAAKIETLLAPFLPLLALIKLVLNHTKDNSLQLILLENTASEVIDPTKDTKKFMPSTPVKDTLYALTLTPISL
jgi:hypothetical protein